ncbi:unnamed protein product, partial [Protopolystoma xenopodis]
MFSRFLQPSANGSPSHQREASGLSHAAPVSQFGQPTLQYSSTPSLTSTANLSGPNNTGNSANRGMAETGMPKDDTVVCHTSRYGLIEPEVETCQPPLSPFARLDAGTATAAATAAAMAAALFPRGTLPILIPLNTGLAWPTSDGPMTPSMATTTTTGDQTFVPALVTISRQSDGPVAQAGMETRNDLIPSFSATSEISGFPQPFFTLH